MKISPLAASVGPNATPGSADLGSSVSPDKVARAKAILQGQAPEGITVRGDAPVAQEQKNVRKIQMRTNATPAFVPPAEQIEEEVKNDTQPAEETKPLSPQYAQLVKTQRALEARERAITAREQELETKGSGATAQALEEYRAALKRDPLGVLFKEGFNYEQLIEAVASGPQQSSPQMSALEQQIKALKDNFDGQTKAQADREAQAEQAALRQIRTDINAIVATDDNYELIRETRSQQDVVDLIERNYRKTGVVMDHDEALKAVEDYLYEASTRIAKTKKVQSSFAPQAPQLPGKQTTTLTSRDGATPQMSRKERAMAAFHNKI